MAVQNGRRCSAKDRAVSTSQALEARGRGMEVREEVRNAGGGWDCSFGAQTMHVSKALKTCCGCVCERVTATCACTHTHGDDGKGKG